MAALALRAQAHLAAPARGSPGARGLPERARPGLWLAGRPRPGPRPRRPRAPQWGRLRAILRLTMPRWNRATALYPPSRPSNFAGCLRGRGGGLRGPVPPVRWLDSLWPGRCVSTQARDVCYPRMQKRKSDKNRRSSSVERERDSGNRMAEVKVIMSGHQRQLSCNGLSLWGGLRSSVWVLTGGVVKIPGPSPFLKFIGGIDTDKPRNLLTTLANDSC